MRPSDVRPTGEARPDAVDRAVERFLRRRSEHWADGDHAALVARLQEEPAEAQVLRRVERAWQAVGNYADSPELMVLREQALTRARRANARRWLAPAGPMRRRWAVASLVAIVLLGVVWQLSPYGMLRGVYRTDIGEQRIVELDDRSTVALDARTRLRVRYSADARSVEITQGQAQFSVAKDPSRPFKVIAGDHTIVALGTVFTVEYVDREVQVAMLEGRVAVFAPPARERSRSAAMPIELAVGEALRVRQDGRTSVTPHADLAAATAWRKGQVIFHDEPLAEAVRRLNRYSRVQIEVTDPALAQLSISGLFETGDTRAFADALQSYLPVTADYSDPDVIELRMK